MSGIAGILNFVAPGLPSEDLLCRMVSILHHRGPDETGIYIDQNVGLGHSRLSIIDLDEGTQPLANEDETLWVVLNGKIFNYVELRKELIKKGHQFRTNTDTEVILHLFEDHGVKCLQYLNGQFAIAIWNSAQKELFLARDRVGICPLFMTELNGRLLFASEIKALFLDPSLPRALDLTSLQQIFTCWSPVGNRTVFQGINQLSPGHYQMIRCGEPPERSKPYWSIPYYPVDQQWEGSLDEAMEELRFLLMDSVRLRLRSEVPVGAYLSGGLDSSILTSIIAKNFNHRLKTFSLGFSGDNSQEHSYQREMVAYLGSDHHRISISDQDVRERFKDVIWHCEKPILWTDPVPSFLLSGLVRDHRYRVVLTGEGADEVFGGYNIFKEAKVYNFLARCPESRIRPELVARIYNHHINSTSESRSFLQNFFSANEKCQYDPLFAHRKRWNKSGETLTFFNRDLIDLMSGVDPIEGIHQRLPEGFADRDIFSRLHWLEMDIFLSNYLLPSQGDSVAMSHNLELRFPYLDHRLIDLAARMPSRWKLSGLKEKYILKKAYRGQIPDSICLRQKKPHRSWTGPIFINRENHRLREMLCMDQVKKIGIFDEQKVRRLFENQHQSAGTQNSEFNEMAVVGVLSTLLVSENFTDRFYGHVVAPVIPDKIVRRIHAPSRYGTPRFVEPERYPSGL